MAHHFLKIFLILAFGFIDNFAASGQKANIKSDSFYTDTTPVLARTYPKPGHVALRSAVLPGWGQATNHQYIKVPILYAGLVTMIYFIGFNNHYFNVYKNGLTHLQNGDTLKIDGYIYNQDELVQQIDYYRHNRDLLVIGTAVLYIANIFDAYVYAHLRSFDVSNNLSLKIEPINLSNIAERNYITCSIKLNFR